MPRAYPKEFRHGQPGWQDSAAWLDGTYVTALGVVDGAIVIECFHDFVSGRDEWLKTPARYELRMPPQRCAVGYGGREWARPERETHMFEYPDDLSAWPWSAGFSLGAEGQ